MLTFPCVAGLSAFVAGSLAKYGDLPRPGRTKQLPSLNEGDLDKSNVNHNVLGFRGAKKGSGLTVRKEPGATIPK